MRKWMLLGVLIGSLLAGAEEKIYDFAAAPELEVTNEATGQPERTLIKSVMELPPTGGQDFAFETVLELTRVQHYASLILTLADASEAGFIRFTLARSDDRVPRCRIMVQEAPGIVRELPDFNAMEAGSYKIQIVYRAANRSLNITIKNPQGEKLYENVDVAMAGVLDFSRFTVAVTANAEQRAEISWLPEKKALFFRSYVGAEDWYAYVVEGFINRVAIRSAK